MMRRALTSLVLALLLYLPGSNAWAAIALVGSQKAGAQANSAASITLAFPANVTAGNRIIIVITDLDGTPGAGSVTKSSGTATLGTITRDASRAANTNIAGLGIYSADVTGSGSLTMLYTASVGTAPQSIGVAEFSGIAASSFVGLTPNNGGTGTAHTTGSIANTTGSLLIYVATEFSSTNQTRTFSDVLIAQSDQGASLYTWIGQYKITSGTPNTLTDTFNESVTWQVLAAEYIAAAGAANKAGPLTGGDPLKSLVGPGGLAR